MLTTSLLLGSCLEEDYSEPANKRMFGSSNAYLLDYNYVSHSANELIVDIQVAAHYGGEAYDDSSLEISDFDTGDFGDYSIDIMDFTYVETTENRSYMNLIFMDRSSGLTEWDSFNSRVRSLNKTIREAYENPENLVGLGSFARDGRFTNDVNWWVADVNKGIFEQSYDDLAEIIYYTHYHGGGSSNLYDAVDEAVELLRFAENPNKNITILTHNLPDEFNTVVPEDIVSKALEIQVKINMISLEEINVGMASIPSRTGGYLGTVTSTSQYDLNGFGIWDKGSPLVSTIHKTLSRDLPYYQLRLRLTKTSGNWESGDSYLVPYEVNDFAGNDLLTSNLIPFYVEIP